MHIRTRTRRQTPPCFRIILYIDVESRVFI